MITVIITQRHGRRREGRTTRWSKAAEADDGDEQCPFNTIELTRNAELKNAHSVARSNSAAVRNPVAADPEVAACMARLAAEHPAAAEALRACLRALSSKWRGQAEHSWRKHKGPVAAYHKANAVNARHLALAIPRPSKRSSADA